MAKSNKKVKMIKRINLNTESRNALFSLICDKLFDENNKFTSCQIRKMMYDAIDMIKS